MIRNSAGNCIRNLTSHNEMQGETDGWLFINEKAPPWDKTQERSPSMIRSVMRMRFSVLQPPFTMFWQGETLTDHSHR